MRVFIASPGGLDDERRRFRQLLLDFNEDDAHARGAAFLPIGWEQTLPGVGRPQELINEDVETSDYMILVLWDRWGSPPSEEGPYTSGTEEEYNVARACLSDADKPMRDIVVLFKGVEERQLSDPGEQLSRVLAFRTNVEDERSLLYGTFDSMDEYDRNVRKHLFRWMRDLDDDRGKEARTAPGPSDAPPQNKLELRSETIDGQQAPEAVETILELADRLTHQGRIAEAESAFARAVVAKTDPKALTAYIRFLRRHGRLNQALTVSNQLLDYGLRNDDPLARIEALSNLGIIQRKRGRVDESVGHLQAAMDIAQGLGESAKGEVAFLYDNIGLSYRKAARFTEAVEMHRLAMETRRTLDDPRGLANSLNNLGSLLRQVGQLEESEGNHREANRIFEELSYERGSAIALGNLGETLALAGNTDAARESYIAALAINQRLDSAEGVGMNYWQLGRLALVEGDFPEAERYARLSLTTNEASSLGPEGIANALHLMGQIELQRKRPIEAEEPLLSALAVYREIGHQIGIAWTLVDLAEAHWQLNPEQARMELKEAMEVGAPTAHQPLQQRITEVIDMIRGGPQPEVGPSGPPLDPTDPE
jgi:tetratricopeptide (TPR) repeat protein